MLVKAEDHKYPVKVTDIGGRDRFGIPKYQYNLEYPDGSTSRFHWPEVFHDKAMKKFTEENFHLDYSHHKQKCFGNDRLRNKFGNPY